MPLPLRVALVLPFVVFAACADPDDPDAASFEAPVAIGSPQLLGTWVLTEENGQAPTGGAEVRYRFTDEGDFVRFTGDASEDARFTFAGDTRVMIDGPEGTRFLDYEVEGEGETLVLTEPGEEGRTLRFRRLPDEGIDAPPPTLEVPVEDALPGGSPADGGAPEE